MLQTFTAFFFQPCTCFHRTTVIHRAQRCNTVISHSLVPEHQTQDAGRTIRAMFWVQAAGCIVRSSAAIFRLSLAIKMTQYSVDENTITMYC